MNKIQRVGIDLDGTVADYMEGVIPLVKDEYGVEPDYRKQAYKIEEVFGWTSDTRPDDMRKHLYEDLHLFRNLPMIEPTSYHLTHQIKSLGAKVYFITARSGTNIIKEDTLDWLEYNHFVFDDIFFTENKGDLCIDMGLDLMIEDEVGQLVDIITRGINSIVPRMPWNSDLNNIISKRLEYQQHQKSRSSRPGGWVYANNRMEMFTAVKEFLS